MLKTQRTPGTKGIILITEFQQCNLEYKNMSSPANPGIFFTYRKVCCKADLGCIEFTLTEKRLCCKIN